MDCNVGEQFILIWKEAIEPFLDKETGSFSDSGCGLAVAEKRKSSSSFLMPANKCC